MSNNEPIRSLDEPFDQPEDPARRRLLGLGLASGLGMVALAGQLWRLQVLGGDAFREQADNNRFRLSRLVPPRGVIFDRNDRPLARNRPRYVIAVVPADLPRPPDPVFRRLARLLGMTSAEIANIVRKRAADPFSPVALRSGVDTKLAYTIEERHLDLPGVQLVVQPVREYVEGRLFSHVIGIVGQVDADEFATLKADAEREYAIDDQIGKMGLELVREPELRGRPGRKRSEVDSAGRELRVLGTDRPRPGSNLTLTLEMGLQREITRLLTEELARFEVASAIALDPRDGQVLAMVHLPTFDNNVFSRELSNREFSAILDDPGRPLINGAIADAYPPGAVFQIVTALAALRADVVKPTTTIECTGALLLPDRLSPGGIARIPCWATHGPQDCSTALANSCNVYFYQAAGGEPRGAWPGVGIDRLSEAAEWLGLGEPSGIGLPNEATGLVPTRTWKRQTFREDWYTGDTYNVAIGQGYVTATPMQLANVIAAVANGGRLYEPRLVLRTTDDRGAVTGQLVPRLRRDLGIDPAKLGVVQTGLRRGFQIGKSENGTVYTGTSWESELRDLAMAGKTGSAEWGPADANGQRATHGWFVGYAPFDSPRLALAIFLRRGRGGSDAARLARRIMAYHFGVDPD